MSEDRNFIRMYLKKGDEFFLNLLQKHKKKPSKKIAFICFN